MNSKLKKSPIPAQQYLESKRQADMERLKVLIETNMPSNKRRISDTTEPIAAPANLVREAREYQDRIDARYERGVEAIAAAISE